MKIIVRIAATAAILGVPAFACCAEPVPSTVVNHADLDLTLLHDIRRLDRRIRNAVDQVCGQSSSADPSGKANDTRCRIEMAKVASAQRDAAIAASRNARLVSNAGR